MTNNPNWLEISTCSKYFFSPPGSRISCPSGCLSTQCFPPHQYKKYLVWNAWNENLVNPVSHRFPPSGFLPITGCKASYRFAKRPLFIILKEIFSILHLMRGRPKKGEISQLRERFWIASSHHHIINTVRFACLFVVYSPCNPPPQHACLGNGSVFLLLYFSWIYDLCIHCWSFIWTLSNGSLLPDCWTVIRGQVYNLTAQAPLWVGVFFDKVKHRGFDIFRRSLFPSLRRIFPSIKFIRRVGTDASKIIGPLLHNWFLFSTFCYKWQKQSAERGWGDLPKSSSLLSRSLRLLQGYLDEWPLRVSNRTIFKFDFFFS